MFGAYGKVLYRYGKLLTLGTGVRLAVVWRSRWRLWLAVALFVLAGNVAAWKAFFASPSAVTLYGVFEALGVKLATAHEIVVGNLRRAPGVGWMKAAGLVVEAFHAALTVVLYFKTAGFFMRKVGGSDVPWTLVAAVSVVVYVLLTFVASSPVSVQASVDAVASVPDAVGAAVPELPDVPVLELPDLGLGSGGDPALEPSRNRSVSNATGQG